MSARLGEELRILLHAVQFLTRIPVRVPFTARRLQASVRYFPLVGLAVGGFSALVLAAASTAVPALLATILAVAATLLLTGAFHEDGLADTFDGVGGGRDRGHALEIMKDSRLGTYGTAALGITIALKVVCLASAPTSLALLALPLAHAASRASAVVVVATSHYVRSEVVSKPTAEGIGVRGLVFALLTGAAPWAIALWLDPIWGLGPALGLGLGHLAMRLFFEGKLGGYTGDALGAVQQASELGFYLGLVSALTLSP